MVKKSGVLIFFTVVLSFFSVNAAAGPKVQVDQPVHTFESIPEGKHVSHTFIVKNSGDAVLNITGVKPP